MTGKDFSVSLGYEDVSTVEKKKLPVGEEDFAEFKQKDFYYVDETMQSIFYMSDTIITGSLNTLSMLLRKHFGKKSSF